MENSQCHNSIMCTLPEAIALCFATLSLHMRRAFMAEMLPGWHIALSDAGSSRGTRDIWIDGRYKNFSALPLQSAINVVELLREQTLSSLRAELDYIHTLVQNVPNDYSAMSDCGNDEFEI